MRQGARRIQYGLDFDVKVPKVLADRIPVPQKICENEVSECVSSLMASPGRVDFRDDADRKIPGVFEEALETYFPEGERKGHKISESLAYDFI